jgi:CheY-like chemotaxis protein
MEKGGFMKSVYNQMYSLPTLIKLGDLDIQKLHETTDMPIEKFYDLVSEVIARAPQMVDSLNKLAASDGTEDDVHNLADLKKLLGRIGYNRITAAIDEIIHASKDEDMALAIPFVKIALDGINWLFPRLLLSRIQGGSQTYNELTLQSEYKLAVRQLYKDELSRRLKILAIDDMLFILQTISQVLSKDYKVYKLTNPTMLETTLQYIQPELFLLDCDMPQRSGFDLVPAIRNYEIHKTTPIIFLTSTGTADNISAAIKLGACDYIVKPFQADLLRQKVAANIARKNNYEI